jgi:NAD(P)-dependent dehydrogenase (short-subunit alcohol dehydrogenase family)
MVLNAGIAIAAPLEFLPPEELERQLDVNVVGQLRVLQAFLPALRRRKGRVVLMGSIGGRSSLPFLGAYAMSKFALEAMSDALRVELAPFGMHVSIVEPGTIATAIWTKPQPTAESCARAAEYYGERIGKFRALAAKRA